MSFPIFVEETTDFMPQLVRIIPMLNNATYWYELADYYREVRNNSRKAELAYRQVIKWRDKNENNGWIYEDIAGVLSDQGKYKQSIKYALKAIKIDPDEYTFWDTYAYASDNLGDYPNAIKAYLKLIRNGQSNRHCNYYQSLADCYIKIQQMGKAIKALHYSLFHDPQDEDTLYNLACMYALSGKKKDALTYLESSFQLTKGRKQHWAKEDPDLQSLWQDKAFKALIRKYA